MKAPTVIDQKISLRIFIGLIVLYVLLAGLSIFLPQANYGAGVPTAQMPASPLILALANAGLVLVIYGGLGYLGFRMARTLGLPEIWDASVSNFGRFLLPALIGLALGLVLVVVDLLFSPVNGIGRLPHPPFPTSIVASLSAGIGEEVMFRLFFISFWTWLVSRVLLRGRWQNPLYWFISLLAALAFALAHLPAVMFLYGWTTFGQVPAMLMVEIILLNGLIGMLAAWAMKKYGFLAPVGVHFWTDMVWHALWGLF
jgi:hypothetical protein